MVSQVHLTLAGSTIDGGRIKLMTLIGSGAYGAVYHSVATHTGVQYAVKVISKEGNAPNLREFSLHQAVSDHPNIVTLHYVLESPRFFYVVMDYHEGGDLFSAMTETAIYAGEDELIRNVFLQILDAVAYCHSKGVYHRDLKPENILCSKDGSQVFLADFGLATQASLSRSFGCGSSYYMSPECIGTENDNRDYSPEISDIWSLGIILINIVTGRNPWLFATSSDGCFQSFLRNKDFLRAMLPISAFTNSILCRTLNPNPDERITIEELRRHIMNVDTFYMGLDELATSNRHVREAAMAYGPLTKPPNCQFHRVDAFGSTLTFTSSTDSDSDGPITPGTRACYPDIEIPDMPEGMGIGEIMLCPGGKMKKLLRVESAMYYSTGSAESDLSSYFRTMTL